MNLVAYFIHWSIVECILTLLHCMCFKIVKNLVDLDASAFFRINLSPYSTRGNSINLSPLSSPHHTEFSLKLFLNQSYTHLEFITRLCGYSILRIIFRSKLSNVDLSPSVL